MQGSPIRNQDQRTERAGLPNLLAMIQNDLIDPTPCNRFPREHDHKGSCQRLTGQSTIRLLGSINGIGSSKHCLILYLWRDLPRKFQRNPPGT